MPIGSSSLGTLPIIGKNRISVNRNRIKSEIVPLVISALAFSSKACYVFIQMATLFAMTDTQNWKYNMTVPQEETILDAASFVEIIYI